MTLPDILILVAYFTSVLIIGGWYSKKEKTLTDFFLGGRAMPWLAVTISILASEVSAVTFIGVPGEVLRPGGNFNYIQFAFGSLIGRILVAFVFMPAFYKHQVTTVYEYLWRRFGEQTRLAGSIFFLVTRLMASGVRLFAMSAALSVIMGWPLWMSLALSAGISVVYTLCGGVKAVVWTDVLQFGVFVSGAAMAIYHLKSSLPQGWETVRQVAGAAGKLVVFDLTLDFTRPMTLWAGIIFGTVITFAVLGTDQDLAQRMLCLSRLKESQKAIVLTGLIDFPFVLLFLTIGALLYTHYQVIPNPAIPSNTDYVFPYYIEHSLPPGLKGYLLAGIFASCMSSLSSALGGLSSVIIVDFVKPHLKTARTDAALVKISRLMVVAFGALLVFSAWIFSHYKGLLTLGFKVGSYTYGALLGVFLLGVLTRRGTAFSAVIGMVTSLPVVILISSCSDLAWPYFIILGTVWTFLVGAVAMPVEGRKYID
ncbi:MAG: sodium/solute symporter [Deltaproteobacteria bacterium]|nr:sodium/solute symporter [Deltaproteobacteria bacterium]